MQFASLGSGSKGNSTVVRAGETLIMVDCGFSMRETVRRLQVLGLDPQQLDAILVTHEHSDHSSGVAALSRKFEIPIYLTHGTASTGRCEGGYEEYLFNCDERFTIGDMVIEAISVPHDAAEPCQYRVSCEERSLGILTDLGSLTPHVINSYRGCSSLLLEFNHDVQMLEDGPYPYGLKRRVGGDWGHLNNEQAAQLLEAIDGRSLQQVVVAHISEKNNSRSATESALISALGSLDSVVFADQAGGFDWLELQ
ncbi:MAG: MBL fold metallo-hydrolase [Halioglobus sp.]